MNDCSQCCFCVLNYILLCCVDTYNHTPESTIWPSIVTPDDSKHTVDDRRNSRKSGKRSVLLKREGFEHIAGVSVFSPAKSSLWRQTVSKQQCRFWDVKESHSSANVSYCEKRKWRRKPLHRLVGPVLTMLIFLSVAPLPSFLVEEMDLCPFKYFFVLLCITQSYWLFFFFEECTVYCIANLQVLRYCVICIEYYYTLYY